jgi:hypothetical protein
MLCCSMAAMWSGRSRRARMPPCTPGCSVLTRPAGRRGGGQVAARQAVGQGVEHYWGLSREYGTERSQLHGCFFLSTTTKQRNNQAVAAAATHRPASRGSPSAPPPSSPAPPPSQWRWQSRRWTRSRSPGQPGPATAMQKGGNEVDGVGQHSKAGRGRMPGLHSWLREAPLVRQGCIMMVWRPQGAAPWPECPGQSCPRQI